MFDVPFETVTKLDAAERQLCEAVRLFFERRDRIAIHTLVGAAHEILHRVGNHSGVQSYIRDLAPIKPTRKNEFNKILNTAQNFFKHADRDPYKTHDFYYEVTKFFIFDAIDMISQLKKSIPKELGLFKMWLLLNHPDFFIDPKDQTTMKNLALSVGDGLNDFDAILEVIHNDAVPNRINTGDA